MLVESWEEQVSKLNSKPPVIKREEKKEERAVSIPTPIVVCVVLAVLVFFAILLGKPSNTISHTIVDRISAPAQVLLQVEVPYGSDIEEIRELHRELQVYKVLDRPLIINYYEGHFSVSTLIAQGSDDGEVYWLGDME